MNWRYSSAEADGTTPSYLFPYIQNTFNVQSTVNSEQMLNESSL